MFSESDFEIYRHAWRYALSPDCESKLDDSQCNSLLQKGGWMVRNTYNFDQKEKSDFWYVIKDSFGGMDELSSNVKRKIRRAFEVFDYIPIDNSLLKSIGYPIIEATYKDYKIKDRNMNQTIFENYLDYCNEHNYDYWGIYDKDKKEIVGFCTVHKWNYSCEYGKTVIWPYYLHNSTYPYYGLYYTMNEYYLDTQKLKYVTDSARSITEHSNIQPFLEQNFNFRKAYCNLKIRYQWWFGILVRILYPFRAIIPSRNVRAVLKMHGMQSK